MFGGASASLASMGCNPSTAVCYWREGATKSWTDARQNCEDNGYELASFHKQVEFDYYQSAFGFSNEYLSLTQTHTSAVHRWLGGYPLTYNAWKNTQPDSSLACVRAHSAGEQEAVTCSMSRVSLCQTKTPYEDFYGICSGGIGCLGSSMDIWASDGKCVTAPDVTFYSVASFRECRGRCVRESYFVCKAFEYDGTALTCKLSATPGTPCGLGTYYQERTELVRDFSCTSYTLSTDQQTWNVANTSCVSGHLALIRSQAEYAHITTLLGGPGPVAWVGMKCDLTTPSQCMFIDLTYPEWSVFNINEPVMTQQCIAIDDNGGTYKAFTCSYTERYICEQFSPPTLCDTAPSLYGTTKTVHSLYGVVEYECNTDFRFLDDTFVKRIPCPCNHDWSFVDNLWASTDETTVADTTIATTTLADTTFAETSLAPSTLVEATIGATTIGATTIEVTTRGTTTIDATTIGPTIIGVTTIGATTIEATTIGPTTIGATTIGATTIEATTIGPTTIGVTTIGDTTIEATTIGPTTIGVTTIGDTTIEATTIGATTIGATSIGATTFGATTIGATTIGLTTIGATTIEATSIGATTIGGTAMGDTTIGATTMGAITIEATTVGATTIEATTIKGTTPAETPLEITVASKNALNSLSPTAVDKGLTVSLESGSTSKPPKSHMVRLPSDPPCSPLITSANMRIYQTGRRAFDVATVSCEEGYGFTEGGRFRTIICGTNGHWIGGVPQCKEIECVNPGTPGRERAGTVVKSDCPGGSTRSNGLQFVYKMCTKASVVQWAELTGLCEGRLCFPLPWVADEYRQTPPWIIATGVSFPNCRHGNTECQDPWSWTFPFIACDAPTCEPLPNPDNCDVRQHKTHTSWVAETKCHPGYYLPGGNTMHHLACEYGVWNGTLLNCTEPRCNPPEPVANGSLSLIFGTLVESFYVYLTTFLVTCDPGFLLLNGAQITNITCDHRQEWWPGNLTCKVNRCPQPPDILHALPQVTGDHSDGSHLWYHCLPAWQFQDQQRQTLAVCNSSSWNIQDYLHSTLGCLSVVTCGSLDVENGDVHRNVNELSVKCHPGYQIELTSSHPIECAINGVWTPEPSCKQIDCGSPPIISNAVHPTHYSTTYGHSITYRCVDGHWFKRYSHSLDVSCGQSGKWNYKDEKCTEQTCLPLPRWRGMKTNSTERAVGTVVEVSCESGAGHDDNNISLIVCDRLGEWSPSPDVCKIIKNLTEYSVPVVEASGSELSGLISVAILAVLFTVLALSDVHTLCLNCSSGKSEPYPKPMRFTYRRRYRGTIPRGRIGR